jgi:hypothetical protein
MFRLANLAVKVAAFECRPLARQSISDPMIGATITQEGFKFQSSIQ